jgi:hypothetical protein
MRRRFIGWAAVPVVLAGTALLLIRLAALPESKPLNVGGFYDVRVGMAQSEVEGLLGGPPGNYGRYAGGPAWMTLEGSPAPPGSVEKVWCDDAHRFEVYFDREGRVVGFHKRAGYSQRPGPSWLERLRAWLGL